MKWWKPLLILLLCATPSWAGFWSTVPGVGPGTLLNDVIIDNSTINSSILNQPIINNATMNGTTVFGPGSIVNYDPSTIIHGPDGSVWYEYGITNLANLDIRAGGVITVGGVPAGGACPANQFYIALSSSLVPTCAPITSIPGPVTIHNPTFTGTVTGPDGGTWTSTGINLPPASNITVGGINIDGSPPNLSFNGVLVGGTCPANEYVYSISSTLQVVCSTPTGGGGGGTIATPVSVANGGLGQGNSPSAGQILVANGPSQYNPVTMSGDATINTAGVITVSKINGVSGPFLPTAGGTVTGPLTVGGAFTANGSATFNSGATISFGLTVPNWMSVNGQATFNGPVSFTNGAIADAALAGAYGGVGACATGLFVTALNRNAPPTCNPAGVIVSATPPATPVDSQLWFNSTDLQTYLRYNDGTSTQWVPVVNLNGATLNSPTINNPTFVGTLQFPDGSYYDTNGHEVMKNLGVGMVAYTNGANAGSGTVGGNSIAVYQSGWAPWNTTASLNGYWDYTGLEQIGEIFAGTFYSPVPAPGQDDRGVLFPEVAVETDPNNTAQQNPFGEYFFQNRSTPRPSADPTWQAEGLEFMNGLGIHDKTWDTSYGCTTGSPGTWLSSCAIVAVAEPNYNNILFKSEVANPSTGTAARAAYELTNNSPHTGGMYLTGTGWTPTATYNADQLVIDTTATNGVAFNPKVVFRSTSSPSVLWGNTTTPAASITSAGASNLNLFAGAHYTPNTWTADAPTAEQIAMYNAPAINFGINSGLTAGSAFTPTWIASITPTGLNIATGTLFVNGQNFFQSGTFTPTIGCTTGNPTVGGAGSIVGNWFGIGHMLFFYAQEFWNSVSGGSGNAVVNGFPYPATGGAGGQGGWQFHVVISNSSTNNASENRLEASMFNGENFSRIFAGNTFAGDYINPLPCVNAWANTPSGFFITGFYDYQ